MRWRRDTVEPQSRTADIPLPPRPGPITSLRVLGHGFVLSLPERTDIVIGRAGSPATHVQLAFGSISRIHASLHRNASGVLVSDQGSMNGLGAPDPRVRTVYHRVDSIQVQVGGRFALGSTWLLALDAATDQLTAPFVAYCGEDEYEDVDRALEGAARGHMMVLNGRGGDLLPLARMIHEHSVRREYPFTVVETFPSSPASIDELFSRAACGTIYLDMREPQAVPARFAQHLCSHRYHTRAIVVARDPHEVSKHFGPAFLGRERGAFAACAVGFPRPPGPNDFYVIS